MVDNAYSCIDVVYPELFKVSDYYNVDIIFTNGEGRDPAKDYVCGAQSAGLIDNVIMLRAGSKDSVGALFWNFMALKKIFNNKKNRYDVVIVGSMVNFEERMVLHKVFGTGAVIVGIVTSMPVMLIRDPRELLGFLSDNGLRECIRSHLVPYDDPKKSSPHFANKLKHNSLKEIAVGGVRKVNRYLVEIFSKSYEKIYIDKRLHKDKVALMSGYVSSGVMDYHFVANNYWKDCVESLYEKELVDSYSNISCNLEVYEERNNDGVNLLLLGPVSEDVFEIINNDVLNLCDLVDINNIEIRSHPRFKRVGNKLKEYLSKTLPIKKGVNRLLLDVDGYSLSDSFNRNDMVLSYYSSAVELNLPGKRIVKIVSTEWNKYRYRKVDIDLLSGACAGYVESFCRLDKEGRLFCKINCGMRSIDSSVTLSDRLKKLYSEVDERNWLVPELCG